MRGIVPLLATCLACAPAPTEGPSPEREFVEIANHLESSRNSYVGRAQFEELVTRLESAEAPTTRAQLRTKLAREHLRFGDLDRASEAVELAWVEIERLLEARPRARELLDLRRFALRTRAQVALRRAEVENCIARHNRDCCIFPLEGGGVHEEDEPAREALELYLQLAREEPDDLTWRWLANLLAMAAGDHPDLLPPDLVIPGEAFDSEVPFVRFRDVAPQVGADVFSLCGGSAVEDFDGDGLLDVAASNFDPRGPLALLMNDARGGFVDRAADAGIDVQLGGLNLVSADYDSDGDADLLVLRGAWLQNEGTIRNSLLRNEGDGSFTDVTRAAGVAQPELPTQTAAFGDFDSDGDLDVYIGNEARPEEGGGFSGYASQLFLNEGDGTFRDSGEAPNHRYCKGVAAGDYDDDGDLDLYVSNIGDHGDLGVNRLYENDGAARFRDVARERGVHQPRWSFATWFFDYDNDGDLDLFVGGYDAKVRDIAASYLGLEDDATRPHLYENGPDGFRDVAEEVGLDRPFLPMGANFGDLDGDGWLDLYLTTGQPPYETLMPNVALLNERGERFRDVTRAAGLGHLQKGHGITFADLDNDGDQDIYHELGGFLPGDGFSNALFENPGSGNRFLYLVLVGTHSNRSAIGARVRVVVREANGTRELHRAVGSVSSFGGAPRRLEVGLGRATAVELVEVRWPRSGEVQRYEGLPLDALVRVTEGRADFERLELVPTPFRADVGR